MLGVIAEGVVYIVSMVNVHVINSVLMVRLVCLVSMVSV